MKKVFFFVFPVALIAAFSTASAYTLSGTVQNEAGTPISGATVQLLLKGKSATTDSDGKFTIEQKTDTIVGLHGDRKSVV